MKLESRPSIQLKKIPGPPVLPILGSLPFVEKHQHLAFTRLAKEYGDVSQIQILSQNIVVINGLETIRQAFLKQSEDFAGRPNLDAIKKIFGGNNIGGRDYGLIWKRHREIVVNALHMFVDRKKMEQLITEDAVELANIFLSYKGQPFNPDMDIYVSVNNIISQILFGEKFDRNNPDLKGIIKVVWLASRIGVASMRFAFLPQPPDIFQLVVNKIKEQKKSYDPENLRGMSDALLKAASEIDDSEKQTLGLTEELIVEGSVQEMMGSGTQPSAPLIAWAILYMIAYPDIQTQVQEELDRVIGKDQALCYDDRLRLPFTQACIHEILRHAPYFPTGLPHATTRDTSLNGYFIPKNTPVYVNLYGLAHDPHYWEEPEKFNPHRFLSKTGEIREDLLEQYYPFSLGKRKCFAEYLGRQEIFLFFAHLMHRCHFTKVPGAQLSFESQKGAISLPNKRYKVIVEPRF
jgi:cytochrome P450